MTVARGIFVSILAVGLVVTLGRISSGHGGGGGGHGGGGHGGGHSGGHEEHHEAHHEGHHEEHHGDHHEGHHEEHPGEHHEAHHEEHPGEHHEAHHEEHPGDHHEAHHEERPGDHHEAHHEEHPGEHHYAHHEDHHGDHPAEHHEEHHDADHGDHHDDHHDDRHAFDDHHEFDHRDWYRHEWWHHQPSWHGHSWQHWWHCPTVANIGAWTAGWGLAAPLYYDYGPTGNVVYRNNQVYVNNTPVGDVATYDQSVFALADATPTTSAASDQPNEWMPLGTFAVLPPNNDGNAPSQTLQLAVNKEGSVSGVLFQLSSDTTTPIHGSVDRSTQRVAFTLGADSTTVAETGLYNLTKNEVSLLVHKQNEKPQVYTLVHLKTPPKDAKDNKDNEGDKEDGGGL